MPDFDIGFRSSAQRLEGEANRRAALTNRSLAFNVCYLHDLVIIAAKTGAGKTTLAEIIGTTNAAQGKRVHYFALEAEPDEIERHLKYRWIVRMALRRGHDIRGMTYPDWYLGRYDEKLGTLTSEADRVIASEYKTLSTYYRARDFTHADIKRLFLAIRNDTDLIILDHLHYVDAMDGTSENASQKEIVKVIRDCALAIGVPIIVVAHLRKRATRKTLLPEVDDVMGSSDIVKPATRVILVAPALDKAPVGSLYPTYMAVEKDRLCGASRYVAQIDYDIRAGRYGDGYYLGTIDMMGESFQTMDMATNAPAWAKRVVRAC